MEQEALFVFVAHRGMQVLSDTELSMQLSYQHESFRMESSNVTHLVYRDTVVLEKQETVIPDSSLDLLNESFDNSRIIAVHKTQIDSG